MPHLSSPVHPDLALFKGEKTFRIIRGLQKARITGVAIPAEADRAFFG